MINLGKLLGAGKSIFGGEAPVVYRQNKQVSLPKFNSGKNPFVSETPKAAEPMPAPAAPVAPLPVAPTPSMPSVPVAAPAAPAMATRVAKTEPSVFSAAPAKPMTPKPVRATNWAEKLNQLWAAKPAPTVPMPNVQPDLLSLDSVKVVHNDLSDVDVEVVPMKSRPATAKPAAATELTVEPALKPV
jgi:hypothetical protein